MGFCHRIDVLLDPYPTMAPPQAAKPCGWACPSYAGGKAHVSRVGVSLLNSVGLSECVAASAEEYVEKAVSLAQDLPKLAAWRAGTPAADENFTLDGRSSPGSPYRTGLSRNVADLVRKSPAKR